MSHSRHEIHTQYDVKKVEDVLYDLSVRDLLQQKPIALEESTRSDENE